MQASPARIVVQSPVLQDGQPIPRAHTADGPNTSPALTWSNFLVGNLLPVTAGNIIGGSVMVAATYWFVYLRKSKPVDPNSGI